MSPYSCIAGEGDRGDEASPRLAERRLMPPIALHMVLAREIATEIGGGAIDPNSGAYLLGATSPDIRVITRQDRYSTHFFDLNDHNHQDSVAAFLSTYGRLAAPENLSPETRDWAAGYVSHLVMDEQYITGMYRPFFARHESLGGTIRANVMDRLLQFDLEQTFCNGADTKAALAKALSGTIEGIEAGFIDSETLERWRGVALDISQRGMDADRMRSMIANHLRISGLQEGETLTTFLDSLPELLNETIAHITSAEVDAFVQRSTEAARKAVERYLGCG